MADLIYAVALFSVSRVEMSGEPQDIVRDERGRYKPGLNTRMTRRMRIAAKLEELRREFFPIGGYSVMDGNRLKLAAQHFVDAESCRDPVVRQRATRCAEYLLSKLKPPLAELPTARELLDRLPP